MENLRKAVEQVAMYKHLIDYAPMLLCIADFDRNLLLVNPSFTRVLGYSQSELMKTGMRPHIHPDDTIITDVARADLMNNSRIIRFENRVKDIKGVYRLMSWDAYVKDGLIYCAGNEVNKSDHFDTY